MHACKFVELETECDGEEKELVCNCDQERNGKIVIVEGVDFHG